mgnify:CR=1 FL=1
MKKDLFYIGRFGVHGYGLMIGIGFILALFLGEYRAKKKGMKEEAIIDLAIIAAVGGFLGAKILYIIVSFKEFLQNPLAVIGSEGFVVYGGIISGVLCCMLYCKVKKLKFLDYFDIVMPEVALAQAFGRIGCFLAGCCYGRETTSRFGVVFPEGGLAPAGVKLIPTQLISSAGDFLIMIVLLLYYRKNKKDGTPGNVGFLYMLLYGVGRFLVEFLRNDNRGGAWMFSTSQWISMVIVAGGIVLYLVNKKRHKR